MFPFEYKDKNSNHNEIVNMQVINVIPDDVATILGRLLEDSI